MIENPLKNITQAKPRNIPERTKKPVNVSWSIYAAKHDYELVRVEDYGEKIGLCFEGHDIRYGWVFKNEEGEEIVLGGVCQWKVFLFKQWKNLKEDEIDQGLLDIGVTLWKIKRDGLWEEVEQYIRINNPGIDLSVIPKKEKRELFNKVLSNIYYKLFQAREKRLKEEKLLKKKKISEDYLKKLLIDDRDFVELSQAKFVNPHDEDIRKSLVNYFRTSVLTYKKQKGWSENQRNLARVLLARNKGKSITTTDVRKKELIQMCVYIMEHTESGFFRDFLGNMILIIGNDRKMSERQKSKLIEILERNIQKKPVWSIRDFIVQNF